ncbi:MAG TPA: amidohydrolase family protein [Planctomycetota bacterium]|nr:amidohydrolase family protein [Planctomycetota bacterium]
MRSDCHIHVRGDETGEGILRAMDRALLDLVCIISWPPASSDPDPLEKRRPGDVERMVETGRMIAGDPERIRGFYWVDPLTDDAPDQVTRAIDEHRYAGVKMIPDHWHPYDERVFPTYERIQELGVPILFHTGILWGNGDSSRFCRPADFEIIQEFPKVRFMLAHIGWPWTDECIAVADRFKTMARKAAGGDPELNRDLAFRDRLLHDPRYEVDVTCRIDLTPGTPPVYRSEALRRCYEVLGADMLLFGTDALGADDLTSVRTHQERDERIFRDELGLTDAEIDRILGTNVLRMFEKL